MFTQMVSKFPNSMTPNFSIKCSHMRANEPYPEQDECSLPIHSTLHHDTS